MTTVESSDRMTTTPSATRRPRVGLLALTLELYEELAPGVRAGREQWLRSAILPQLETIADVTFDRAVFRAEDVQEVVARYEAAGIDALLVVCLTYSPSQIALPALTRTRLPILVWNTQEMYAVGGDFSGEQMIDNHGVHGTQDLCNVLLRSGIPFEYVTSHVENPQALKPLADFFAAAAAAAGLRRLRLGLMGYPFPGMGDFAVDSTHMAATLGCQWISLPVEDYIERAADAPIERVQELTAEYRERYDVSDDVTAEDLENTARAELSLRQIVADRNLGAMTYQFMAFGEDSRTVTLPFVAISRLMADGIGFAGEGDLVGAAGAWLLNRLQPPATFSEIFTVDFQGNGLLLSHMGEANVAMARQDRRIPLLARPKPITRTRGRQLASATSFEPGPATLAALTLGPAQRWRLLAARMRIEDFGPLPGMPVPHSKLSPHDADVRDWLTAYAKAGGPHHNALCFGNATGNIRALARLLDADYCEV
ncbi:MAG: hypothetical protein GXY83_19250 [Rhodopirellula sp.]|nr:hypothetical protein [Rhodopirellula sp.]